MESLEEEDIPVDADESLMSTGGDHSQEETEAGQTRARSKNELVKLPLSRVRHIAKLDPDVNLMNAEAVFLITKSAELFIDSLTKEAYKFTAESHKKTVQKRDLERAVDNVDALVFLEGMMDIS